MTLADAPARPEGRDDLGQAGLDAGTTMAAQSYVDTVLPQVPRPLATTIEDLTGLPPGHRDLAEEDVAEEA